jgi:dephospho-CoA kinase
MYDCPIPIIGLTGGIATGKSTVSSLLRNAGHPLICADELVHQIYTLNSTKKWLAQYAPQAIQDESIDFKMLRSLFFNDRELKKTIEQYIYQALPGQFHQALQSLTSTYVIYDIPLLFEKSLQAYFDRTVLVYCPEHTQIERLVKRDQMTITETKKILAHQLPIEEKKKLADHIIDNSIDQHAPEQYLKETCLTLFNQLTSELEND